ncbi:hypothetical protein CRYUN_Cryun02cG0038700 [Craigia yunnanensis]
MDAKDLYDGVGRLLTISSLNESPKPVSNGEEKTTSENSDLPQPVVENGVELTVNETESANADGKEQNSPTLRTDEKLDYCYRKKKERIELGNRDDIEAMNYEAFEVIIATDVAYIPEAIAPLFSTARELISSDRSTEKNQAPALILCHIFRLVDEPSILSAASQFGFRFVDKWAKRSPKLISLKA